jgi:hypothetical protein
MDNSCSKFSPLKPLGQIKQNFIGIVCGRSSVRFPHFIPIGQKTWLPCAIYVLIDWNLENLLLWNLPDTVNCYSLEMMYGRFCTKFRYGRHRQFLFMIGQLKKSSLKPFGQINWNFIWSTYVRFCLKFPQNKMTGEVSDTGSAHWASS